MIAMAAWMIFRAFFLKSIQSPKGHPAQVYDEK